MDRKLVRVCDGHQVAGVCTGLGAYFGIDPVWIRLAFLLAMVAGGPGLLAYVILWIAMPSDASA